MKFIKQLLIEKSEKRAELIKNIEKNQEIKLENMKKLNCLLKK